MPRLAHKVRPSPMAQQIRPFKQVAEALAPWSQPGPAGPNSAAKALNQQWCAIQYRAFPRLRDIHRDVPTEPVAGLGDAWRWFSGQND